MQFLYDWDFIFRFVLTLKFGARHRCKVIIWFDLIQIAHFMNVSFTSGSSQTEAGWRFRHSSSLPDFAFHGDWRTTDFT